MEVRAKLHALADLSSEKEPQVRTELEINWVPQPVSTFRKKRSCPCPELYADFSAVQSVA